jgi:serine/threonine-protein kinase
MSAPRGNLDSSAPYFTPQRGDVLAGKYRVESTLGAGGMGVVVLVEHIELGQQMAIKLMTPGVSHDTQAVARFLREARAAAGIQSEHVVRIFDVGTFETGAPYMVMELLRGEDLGQLLTNVGRLPIQDAVDYVLQGCHAIAEAHAMGIVHRDLKPSNLFLTRRSDGSAMVKVLDFGISKAMNADREGMPPPNLTATSAVMGSPLYMSPEQVRNAKQVDARADIWSLGVILHELLTGGPAFHADTLPGICAAIIADDPPPLRSLRSDAPPELEAVLTRCLEKSVNRRFQSVRELMASLRPFGSVGLQQSLPGRPIAATLPSSGNPPALSSGRGAASPARGSSIEAEATQLNAVTPPRPQREGSPGSEPETASWRRAPTSKGAEAARKGRTRTLIAFAGLAIAATAAIAITSLRRVEPHAAPAAPVSTPAEAPAARKAFTLFVDSTPSGASVFEGDHLLGNTPLQISVDNESARRELRKITVRREGFQPYSILQGPSEDNVRVSAQLVEVPDEPSVAKGHPAAPTPARPVKAKPVAAPAEPTPQPSAAPPPPVANPSSPDIRLQR